jgi:hypothetical protein
MMRLERYLRAAYAHPTVRLNLALKWEGTGRFEGVSSSDLGFYQVTLTAVMRTE